MLSLPAIVLNYRTMYSHLLHVVIISLLITCCLGQRTRDVSLAVGANAGVIDMGYYQAAVVADLRDASVHVWGKCDTYSSTVCGANVGPSPSPAPIVNLAGSANGLTHPVVGVRAMDTATFFIRADGRTSYTGQGSNMVFGYSTSNYFSLSSGAFMDNNAPPDRRGDRAFATMAMLSPRSYSACGIYGTGEVTCWGITVSNSHNLVGPGGGFSTPSYHSALGSKAVVQAAVHSVFTCLLSYDGIVACGGTNANCEVGTCSGSSNPLAVVAMPGGGRAVAIQAGTMGAGALLEDGRLVLWGGSSECNIGAPCGGTCGGLSPFVAAHTGGFNPVLSFCLGDYFGCLVYVNGTAACWGKSNFNGISATDVKCPTRVNIPGCTSCVVAVACGGETGCLLSSTGEVYCFGSGSNFQTGLGNSNAAATPTRAATLSPNLVNGGPMVRRHTQWPAVLAVSLVESTGTVAVLHLTVLYDRQWPNHTVTAYIENTPCMSTTRIIDVNVRTSLLNADGIHSQWACVVNSTILSAVSVWPAPVTISFSGWPGGLLYATYLHLHPQHLQITAALTPPTARVHAAGAELTYSVTGACSTTSQGTVRFTAPQCLLAFTFPLTATFGSSTYSMSGCVWDVRAAVFNIVCTIGAGQPNNAALAVLAAVNGVGSLQIISATYSASTTASWSCPGCLLNSLYIGDTVRVVATGAFSSMPKQFLFRAIYDNDTEAVPCTSLTFSGNEANCAITEGLFANLTVAGRNRWFVTTDVNAARLMPVTVRMKTTPILQRIAPSFCVRDAGFVNITLYMSEVFNAVNHAAIIGGVACSTLRSVTATSTLECSVNCAAMQRGNESIIVWTRGFGWQTYNVWDSKNPLQPAIDGVNSTVVSVGGSVSINGRDWRSGCGEGPLLLDAGVFETSSNNAASRQSCTSITIAASNSSLVCTLPRNTTSSTLIPYVIFAGQSSLAFSPQTVTVQPDILQVSPSWCLRPATQLSRHNITMTRVYVGEVTAVRVGNATCQILKESTTHIECACNCSTMAQDAVGGGASASGMVSVSVQVQTTTSGWLSANSNIKVRTLWPVVVSVSPSLDITPGANITLFGSQWDVSDAASFTTVDEAGCYSAFSDGLYNASRAATCTSWSVRRDENANAVVTCTMPIDVGEFALPYVRLTGVSHRIASPHTVVMKTPQATSIMPSYCLKGMLDLVDFVVVVPFLPWTHSSRYSVWIGGVLCSVTNVNTTISTLYSRCDCNGMQANNRSVVILSSGFRYASSADLLDPSSPLIPSIDDVFPATVNPGADIQLLGNAWQSSCGEGPAVTAAGIYGAKVDGSVDTANVKWCVSSSYVPTLGQLLRCSLPSDAGSLVYPFVQFAGLPVPVISSVSVTIVQPSELFVSWDSVALAANASGIVIPPSSVDVVHGTAPITFLVTSVSTTGTFDCRLTVVDSAHVLVGAGAAVLSADDYNTTLTMPSVGIRGVAPATVKLTIVCQRQQFNATYRPSEAVFVTLVQPTLEWTLQPPAVMLPSGASAVVGEDAVSAVADRTQFVEYFPVAAVPTLRLWGRQPNGNLWAMPPDALPASLQLSVVIASNHSMAVRNGLVGVVPIVMSSSVLMLQQLGLVYNPAAVSLQCAARWVDGSNLDVIRTSSVATTTVSLVNDSFPTVYYYGIETDPFVYSIAFTPQPVSLASLVAADIQCSVRVDSLVFRNVLYRNDDGAGITVDVSTLKLLVRGFQLRPTFSGSRADTNAIVQVSCMFRGLAMQVQSHQMSMAQIDLEVLNLPSHIMPSSASSRMSAPDDVVLRLVHNTTRTPVPAFALNYTCTLSVYRTFSSRRQLISQAALLSSDVGSQSVATVSWSGVSLIAPPGGFVQLRSVCVSQLGGPDVMRDVEIAVIDIVPVWTTGTTLVNGTVATVSFPGVWSANVNRNGVADVRLMIASLPTEPRVLSFVEAAQTSTSPCAFNCSGGNGWTIQGVPRFDSCDAVASVAGFATTSFHSSIALPPNAQLAMGNTTLTSQVDNGHNVTAACDGPGGEYCSLYLVCRFGDYNIFSAPVFISLRTFRVSMQNASGITAYPSSRTVRRPLGDIVVDIMTDDFRLVNVGGLATRCTLSVQFEAFYTMPATSDVLLEDISLQARPATSITDAASSGSVTFYDVGVIAPQGATLKLSVSCQRAISTPAAVSYIRVHVTSASVTWCDGNLTSRPQISLYHRTAIPLDVCVYLVRPNNVSTLWQPSTMTPVRCVLEIARSSHPDEISLLGGAGVSNGWIDSFGSARVQLMMAMTASNASADVTIACNVLDVEYRATEIQVRRAELQARWISAPATTFYPSTLSRLLPVRPVPSLRIYTDDGWGLAGAAHAGLVCSVAVRADATLNNSIPTRVLDAPIDNYAMSSATSIVNLTNLYIASSWGASVALNASCVRAQGDFLQPLRAFIRTPQPFLRFLNGYEPFDKIDANSVQIVLAEVLDLNTNGRLVLHENDNTFDCNVVVIPTPFTITGGSIKSLNGLITISDLRISAFRGANFTAELVCGIGDALPAVNALSWGFTIQGCMEGQEPNAAVGGSVCTVCANGMHSRGGAAPCTPCPADGVVCAAGIVTMKSHYYVATRPGGATDVVTDVFLHPLPVGVSAAVRVVAFDAALELHPCVNTEACYLNESSRTYGCSAGYSGALCGVCDKESRYSRVGDRCVSCLSSGANAFLMFIGVVVVVAVLIYISLFMAPSNTLSRPLWRMMVNYVSSLASLGIYAARGTETWRRFVSYTNSLVVPGAGTTLNLSPIACEMPLTFHSRYYLTLAAPFLVAAICCVINGVYLLIQRRKRGFDASQGSLLSHMRSKAVSVSMLVVFLMYPSLTSQAFTAFKCTSTRIAGVHYLLADLAVDCESPAHRAATTIAWIVVFFFCMGIPACFAYLLFRNRSKLQPKDASSEIDTDALTFERSFSFLYQGYRLDNLWCYSYECIIMVRKAMIILIGAVSIDAVYESMGAITLVMLSLVLHLYVQPFAFSLYNHLETAALLALGITQIVSLLYLRSGDTLTAGINMHRSIDGSIDVPNDAAIPRGLMTDLATTAILLLINLSVLLTMAYVWVVLRRAEIDKGSKLKQVHKTLPWCQRYTKPLTRWCRLLCCIGKPITIQAKQQAAEARIKQNMSKRWLAKSPTAATPSLHSTTHEHRDSVPNTVTNPMAAAKNAPIRTKRVTMTHVPQPTDGDLHSTTNTATAVPAKKDVEVFVPQSSRTLAAKQAQAW